MYTREEVQASINAFAQAFDDILHFVKCLPKNEQARYLSPDVFGVVSAFLARSEPFEPAFYKGPTVEDLAYEFEEEIEEDFEDFEEEVE